MLSRLRRMVSSMRISQRLIISLIVGVTLVAIFFTYIRMREEKRVLKSEVERQAAVLGDGLVARSIESLLGDPSHKELRRFAEEFGNREHLVGIAAYDDQGRLLAVTSALAPRLTSQPTAVAMAETLNHGYGEFVRLDQIPMYIYALPLVSENHVVGALAIFHEAGFIEAQSLRLWRDTFLGVLVQTLFITLATLLIIRWTVVGPVAKTAQWMRELRTGRAVESHALPEAGLFAPLTQEVTLLAQSLEAARAAAEEEARLRETAESLWTPERLRVHVHTKLQDRPLFVVSNREPYMHVHQGKIVETLVPASGLVTALEPILRACDGTWIAHGAGDADREVVDQRGCLRVPPEEPLYTLRRVWMSKEEEEGYYYGFANEGLWPLCHIAHTRPTFRAADWEHYQIVNRKFANALAEELAGAEQPVVLVQDYHFALLPRLVKELRPDARVAIFWHIPWPNPEAFGICPWQRQLLEGLLGADLIGFHIQSHCHNFLETVDRALESRIEWEHSAVNRDGHYTQVRAFPISVEAPVDPGQNLPPAAVYLERAALFKELGVSATFMGIGVDRVDYTKGIIERFRGVERFLQKHPSYQGQFTLVQIGAPSRTHIKRYQDFLGEVKSEADRINWRFQSPSWRPIVYLERHHTHSEINQYYQAADLCLVTSLHDGMNLVAKEYVAARHDEGGVLILSRFTGASRELRDALVVNPYDTEQVAEAIRFALEMDPAEKSARMRRMRQVVTDHNIYWWAANLTTELAEIRLENLEATAVR